MFDVSKGLFSLRWGIAALAIAVTGFTFPTPASAQVSGAVFTTDAACDGTNLNNYDTREEVYLDGGPRKEGSAGLPDGNYWVKVTDPSGATLLGSSTSAVVHVTDGEFDMCYQLWAILVKGSDQTQGYDLTPNNGGEYKVWASKDPNFAPSATKTDNFKVQEGCQVDCGGGGGSSVATLIVEKYYDANANGELDEEEGFLDLWKIKISGCTTKDPEWTTFEGEVTPDVECVVSEYMPTQNNWINTDPGGGGTPTKSITIAEDETGTVQFGNVCLGAGGGHTLGFWSNKNGEKALNGTNCLAGALALNLVNIAGVDTLPEFRTWILGATATNMAYMLSAQLAAMYLNVCTGIVDGGALIYAPGTNSANALGFATVQDIMDEANSELGLHPDTTSGSPDSGFRAYQEALKNALDKANNNLNFVQAQACPYTF